MNAAPRALIAHTGADTGGVAIGIKRAFSRCAPSWGVRSLVRGTNYLEYPADLRWRPDVARQAWRQAEVIHLFNHFRAADMLGRGAPKPLVIHHHGAQFRAESRRLLAEQRRRNAIGIVSTLDLWLLAPEDTEWVPAPFDLDWLWSLRQDRSGPLRIAHAPTDRGIKSTDALIAAVDQLRREGHVLELDLIEHQPWQRCLARKATADVYFDQVQLGYGNNAIEAWGMGIPVIAGAAAATLEEMGRRFGTLPFCVATEATIVDALRDLVESHELRVAYARRGLEHARRWHADRVVVPQLQDVYRRAYELHHGAAPSWAA